MPQPDLTPYPVRGADGLYPARCPVCDAPVRVRLPCKAKELLCPHCEEHAAELGGDPEKMRRLRALLGPG